MWISSKCGWTKFSSTLPEGRFLQSAKNFFPRLSVKRLSCWALLESGTCLKRETGKSKLPYCNICSAVGVKELLMSQNPLNILSEHPPIHLHLGGVCLSLPQTPQDFPYWLPVGKGRQDEAPPGWCFLIKEAITSLIRMIAKGKVLFRVLGSSCDHKLCLEDKVDHLPRPVAGGKWAGIAILFLSSLWSWALEWEGKSLGRLPKDRVPSSLGWW